MALRSASRPLPSNPTGPLKGDPPPDIPRDQWGRPLVIPFSTWRGPDFWYTPVGMTRASTLGSACEYQRNLSEWREGRVALGMGKRPDLVLAAKTCTAAPADKSRLKEIARKAAEAAESDAAATVGTSIHHLADMVDRGQQVPDVGEYNATVEAYRATAAYFTFHAIEIFTVNEAFGAAGTADRIASPNGYMIAPDGTVFGPDDRLIWDLKTSQTADFFGIKFAVQFTVYALGQPYRHLAVRSTGARKSDIEAQCEYLPWPDGIAPSHEWGLICHAPSGGDTAELHWVPLVRGVELARLSNEVLEARKETLVVPASLPVAQLLNGHAPSKAIQLTSAIEACQSEDEVRRLWENNTDAWTQECTIIAASRIKELNRPEHVVQLDLIAKIKEVEDRATLDRLWNQYGGSSIWDDACTRMAKVVLRGLP